MLLASEFSQNQPIRTRASKAKIFVCQRGQPLLRPVYIYIYIYIYNNTFNAAFVLPEILGLCKAVETLTGNLTLI